MTGPLFEWLHFPDQKVGLSLEFCRFLQGSSSASTTPLGATLRFTFPATHIVPCETENRTDPMRRRQCGRSRQHKVGILSLRMPSIITLDCLLLNPSFRPEHHQRSKPPSPDLA